MRKSELRQIIREEIQNLLESKFSGLYMKSPDKGKTLQIVDKDDKVIKSFDITTDAGKGKFEKYLVSGGYAKTTFAPSSKFWDKFDRKDTGAGKYWKYWNGTKIGLT